MLINTYSQFQDYSVTKVTNKPSLNDDNGSNAVESKSSGIQELAKQYNFRAMTGEERLNFANSAISMGELSLKEAAGLIPPSSVMRVETNNGYTIEEINKPANYTYNVIEELESSISASKQHGELKGIEFRENLLLKLKHLDSSLSISDVV